MPSSRRRTPAAKPSGRAWLWLLSTAAQVRPCYPPRSLRRPPVFFRSANAGVSHSTRSRYPSHPSLSLPVALHLPLGKVVRSPPFASHALLLVSHSALVLFPFFPRLGRCRRGCGCPPPPPLSSTTPSPRPMVVTGEGSLVLFPPPTLGIVSTTPVANSCAGGKPPQLPASRSPAARNQADASSVDAGVDVNGGGCGDGDGLGACEVGPVARIVRPTNPMTRDPAFVLALRRGEGVGGGGWSVGEWGGVGNGRNIRSGRNGGSGEDWSICRRGGEAV